MWSKEGSKGETKTNTNAQKVQNEPGVQRGKQVETSSNPEFKKQCAASITELKVGEL